MAHTLMNVALISLVLAALHLAVKVRSHLKEKFEPSVVGARCVVTNTVAIQTESQKVLSDVGMQDDGINCNKRREKQTSDVDKLYSELQSSQISSHDDENEYIRQ